MKIVKGCDVFSFLYIMFFSWIWVVMIMKKVFGAVTYCILVLFLLSACKRAPCSSKHAQASHIIIFNLIHSVSFGVSPCDRAQKEVGYTIANIITEYEQLQNLNTKLH